MGIPREAMATTSELANLPVIRNYVSTDACEQRPFLYIHGAKLGGEHYRRAELAFYLAAKEFYLARRRVVITDVNEYRLDLARKMGVDAAVNTAKEDLRKVMHEQGLTEGFDVGLEMSGNAAAFHQLISVMRSGGKVSLLGLGDGPISVDMNQIITNGLTLQGIYGRKMDNWHQMSYMVQGGLDLTPVITHRFHYTDFQKGFDAMMSGRSGKVVLDWTK